MKLYYKRMYQIKKDGRFINVAKVYIKIGSWLIPTPLNRFTDYDH